MRTFHKLVVGIGLAGALSLGVIWGSRAPAIQRAASATVEYIQKPGHGDSQLCRYISRSRGTNAICNETLHRPWIAPGAVDYRPIGRTMLSGISRFILNSDSLAIVSVRLIVRMRVRPVHGVGASSVVEYAMRQE